MESLEKYGWEALMIGPSVDMEYLCGVKIRPDERLTALFILKDGRCFCVAPGIYHIEMKRHFCDMPLYLWDDLSWFPETMSRALSDYGLIGAGIALTAGIRSIDAADIARGDGVIFYNGENVIAGMRQIKDAREIDNLRISSEIADKVMNDLRSFLRPGMKENEAGEFIAAKYTEYGAYWRPGAVPIVASGPNGALTHYDEGVRTIGANDVVVVDSGARYHDYYSDITRTFFVGRPTDEQSRVFETVLAAQMIGEESVKPGVPASYVDKMVRDCITRKGYGKYFTHRTGHGIGREGHERPYISSSDDTVLEPGMVFSIEPGIYIPGKFGVRIENTVLVTENGCESLNKAPKKLMI